MAWRAGITSILVLSGESSADDVNASPRKPDYVLPGVGSLCEMLQK
jgi:ribonucleotide monophosphatase NagD (HAD superfamily)